MLVIVIVSINLQLKFTTVTLCNYWQHLERLNFSYTFAGNVYAEAEVQKHHLPGQCLNNLFAEVI